MENKYQKRATFVIPSENFTQDKQHTRALISFEETLGVI